MALAAKGSRAARKPSPEATSLADPEGKKSEADPVEVAKQIVMRQLSISAKSRHQLAQVLAKRAVPTDAAEIALDRYTELGYIDDEVFARSWVESRQRSRNLAGSALRRELREKGIDIEIIDAVLIECVDPDAERVAAAELVDKKLRSMSGVDGATATRRLVSMLARKGYSPGLAFAVVREQLASVAVGERSQTR